MYRTAYVTVMLRISTRTVGARNIQKKKNLYLFCFVNHRSKPYLYFSFIEENNLVFYSFKFLESKRFRNSKILNYESEEFLSAEASRKKICIFENHKEGEFIFSSCKKATKNYLKNYLDPAREGQLERPCRGTVSHHGPIKLRERKSGHKYPHTSVA